MYNQNSDLMKQEKFMLPTMIEGDFSAEELAEDADGLQMSFQRVKIPAGGTLQFEMPSDDPDNPDYEKTLVGVILHNHATCAYWPAGSEYDDDTTPLCSSVDKDRPLLPIFIGYCTDLIPPPPLIEFSLVLGSLP